MWFISDLITLKLPNFKLELELELEQSRIEENIVHWKQYTYEDIVQYYEGN